MAKEVLIPFYEGYDKTKYRVVRKAVNLFPEEDPEDAVWDQRAFLVEIHSATQDLSFDDWNKLSKG